MRRHPSTLSPRQAVTNSNIKGFEDFVGGLAGRLFDRVVRVDRTLSGRRSRDTDVIHLVNAVIGLSGLLRLRGAGFENHVIHPKLIWTVAVLRGCSRQIISEFQPYYVTIFV